MVLGSFRATDANPDDNRSSFRLAMRIVRMTAGFFRWESSLGVRRVWSGGGGADVLVLGGEAVLVVLVFPEAKEDAGSEEAEEGIEDDVGPSREVFVGPVQDAVAVEDGEGGFGSVADRASASEGEEELAAGDAEGSGGEQEGEQGEGGGRRAAMATVRMPWPLIQRSMRWSGSAY